MASSSSPAASTSTSAAASTSSCIPSIGPVSPGLVSGHVQSTPSTSSLQHLPKSIHIDDKIHGAYTITEPVLVDLLLSKPIDRLKRVLQHGISSLVGLTPLPAVTRYEHSVGAMLLVRAAGGSVEAQAAALLHDVAHTSLSHVVDGVFGYVVHEDDKMEYLYVAPSDHMHGLSDRLCLLQEHNHNTGHTQKTRPHRRRRARGEELPSAGTRRTSCLRGLVFYT